MSTEELAAMNKQAAACKAEHSAESALLAALEQVKVLRLAHEKAHAAHVVALKELDTIQGKTIWHHPTA